MSREWQAKKGAGPLILRFSCMTFVSSLKGFQAAYLTQIDSAQGQEEGGPAARRWS